MPVGHRRFNNPNADPNDNITFIRVLEHFPDADQAQKILDALAAQFKPIMKQWGFGVNSLVEHEWNPVFAGRNWNAGEIVEIVLRRKDGSFAPYQFLLYVMCHELAHIREMNHSWAFQAVNTQLRQALTALRAKGYYGDGFWSTGRSLEYATAAAPLAHEDEPTYTCGGANRSRRRRRRAPNAQAGPSKPRGEAVKLGTTGRQTKIAPKAGGRVQRKGAFPEGEGVRLSEDPEQSSFRRRAQAKDAVAARAAAAEARLAAERRAKAAEARAAGGSSPAKPRVKPEGDVLVLDSDEDGEDGPEAGGWETDDEDKPEVKLEEEEKRFLEEDMRGWRGAFGAEDEDVKPVVDGSSGAKGKGKAMATASASDGGSAKSKASASASGSARKRRPSPSPPPPMHQKQDDDLLALDLTPEERAWLAAEAVPSADGVERVGKRSRVAEMAMPEWMGGTGPQGKGKGKASTSRRSPAAEDSDEEIVCDSEDEALSPMPRNAQTSSSDRKRVRASSEESAFMGASSSRTPAGPAPAPSPARRKPMKFFATGTPSQPALDLAPPPPPAVPKGKKPVAPRVAGAKAPGKGKGKGKAVRPPSPDDNDDSEDQEEKKPAKKPRKTRSDKGVKRGPYKPRKPRAAASGAGGVGVDRLEQIRRERDRDDHELDWTDEEPAAVRAGAKKANKGGGQNGLVVVGLELRALPAPAPAASTSSASRAPATPPPRALDLAASPATSASSVFTLPSPLFPSAGSATGSWSEQPSPVRAAALAHLESQERFNARLAEKRAARAEEEARRAEEAKRRIERRAEEVQREAAARPPVEGARGRATGWGRNVFVEGMEGDAEARATRNGMLAEVVAPVAGGSGEVDARVAEENAKRGRKWRCAMCEFDNDAALPTCEVCESGARRECAGWFESA
ncbi:hypothetical protein JCM10450v2_002229 [Rhodotorula kratochvilovae]